MNNIAVGQNSCNCLEDNRLNPTADSYLCHPNVYNPRLGDTDMKFQKGHKVSEETRRKISEAIKGYRHTDEAKKKISEFRKSFHASEETRKKMSMRMSGTNHPMFGKHHTAESNKKNSEAHKGKHLSEETKAKLSVAFKGRIFSEEWRVKLSAANKGRKPSAEAIKKATIANKGKIRSFEFKHRVSLALTGRKHTKEHNRKVSEALKGKYIGKESLNWRGGKKLSLARTNTRRKRELGFVVLNDWEANTPNFVGHHLDKEHVLYIPKELHDSVRHRQDRPTLMNRINEAVINWYTNYYGLR